MRYSDTIVLEPAQEGGYTVKVPALPAVITEGNSYEEAIDMARDAINLYIQHLIDEGRPIPADTPPQAPMTMRLDVEAPAAS